MDIPMIENLYAVIMAGGRGERFWPAGRENRPKQFLSLLGEKTMVEETVQRLFPMFPPEHVLVITNQSYVKQARELLPIPSENVIGEPVGRDTAPCVALATAVIARKNSNATMVLLPADHVIRPAKKFQETLKASAEEARKGFLVTVGIMPTCPATGYGYLHLGEKYESGFYKVSEFIEKPEQKKAMDFIMDGNYRWNSGIFVWTAATIRKVFAKYVPELSVKLEGWINGGDYRDDFADCLKVSIDYAIMEKAEGVVAVDAPFFWNDIGTWSAFRSVLPLDADGNAVQGNFKTLESCNNVLFNDDTNMLVGVIGMHDIAVVKSGNGFLVCPLSQEQKIRNLVKAIDPPQWR